MARNRKHDIVKPSRFKTTVCSFFLSPDGCPFGDKCAFAHGEHELRAVKENDTHLATAAQEGKGDAAPVRQSTEGTQYPDSVVGSSASAPVLKKSPAALAQGTTANGQHRWYSNGCGVKDADGSAETPGGARFRGRDGGISGVDSQPEEQSGCAVVKGGALHTPQLPADQPAPSLGRSGKSGSGVSPFTKAGGSALQRGDSWSASSNSTSLPQLPNRGAGAAWREGTAPGPTREEPVLGPERTAFACAVVAHPGAPPSHADPHQVQQGFPAGVTFATMSGQPVPIHAAHVAMTAVPSHVSGPLPHHAFSEFHQLLNGVENTFHGGPPPGFNPAQAQVLLNTNSVAALPSYAAPVYTPYAPLMCVGNNLFGEVHAYNDGFLQALLASPTPPTVVHLPVPHTATPGAVTADMWAAMVGTNPAFLGLGAAAERAMQGSPTLSCGASHMPQPSPVAVGSLAAHRQTTAGVHCAYPPPASTEIHGQLSYVPPVTGDSSRGFGHASGPDALKVDTRAVGQRSGSHERDEAGPANMMPEAGCDGIRNNSALLPTELKSKLERLLETNPVTSAHEEKKSHLRGPLSGGALQEGESTSYFVSPRLPPSNTVNAAPTIVTGSPDPVLAESTLCSAVPSSFEMPRVNEPTSTATSAPAVLLPNAAPSAPRRRRCITKNVMHSSCAAATDSFLLYCFEQNTIFHFKGFVPAQVEETTPSFPAVPAAADTAGQRVMRPQSGIEYYI